ncbi:hypothetical protein ACPOL_4526 [Acidisarcina polymorpha]|uniref:Uncharacterized protein n=1 Tax=Acidisarcina polymorpha TaxID=2211140 RepID=A0A2Z5G3W2_9BACT|nr:hypothetical protein [Acidisarcina polymorpha]AXC13798.1 hypothetical protein ACPOL_4526 [Acidisarcina polymorpha]
MLDRNTSDSPTTMSSQLYVCPSNPPQESQTVNVLLVEPAMSPRSDREAVLSAGAYCVTAVCDVRGIFLLRDEKPVAFAVINDTLGPFGLRATAECVRRQWPLAKILILGRAAPALEDHLYDEAISHRHEATAFLDVLQMLVENRWSKSMSADYAKYGRAGATLQESDPTKSLGQEPAQARDRHDVPGGLYRMSATG